MNISNHLAAHLRAVYFGGNWTVSNVRAHLADVTWQQATTRVKDLNTIAMLLYHMHYYVCALSGVLQGKPLEAKDAYSFDVPPIASQADWEQLLAQVWADAEHTAKQIEALPEQRLDEIFVDEKYGTYYRNIQGIIEHLHYHLGQIVLLKKLL